VKITLHSTNYNNCFILVASDYVYDFARFPKEGTIGALQLDLVQQNPYKYTSDDLLFMVHAIRNDISQDDKSAHNSFFAKPQACLRASPLVKTLGFGVHHDENSKIAVFPIESADYKRLLNDKNTKKVLGMRTKRAQ
jgi:Family of unknown function (DUF6157)